MKRSIILIVTGLLILSIGGCKKESKYAKEIATLKSVVKEANLLAEEVGKTSNRIAYGKSVVEFIRNYKTLKPEMAKMEALYPDLKVTGGAQNAPEELKPYIKDMVDALRRMWAVIKGKLTKWSLDKPVHDLAKDLREVLYYY